MAWTLVYDEVCFLHAIEQRHQALRQALADPGLDHDAFAALRAHWDDQQHFVDAVLDVADALAHDRTPGGLLPLAQPRSLVPYLHLLHVGSWRGYFLLDTATRGACAMVAVHGARPLSRRLEELSLPWLAARPD